MVQMLINDNNMKEKKEIDGMTVVMHLHNGRFYQTYQSKQLWSNGNVRRLYPQTAGIQLITIHILL